MITSPNEFTEKFEATLEDLIATGRPFTADDCRRTVSPALKPHHPNVVGSMFMTASRAGRIRPVGWLTSTRKSRRGATVRLWIGVTQ